MYHSTGSRLLVCSWWIWSVQITIYKCFIMISDKPFEQINWHASSPTQLLHKWRSGNLKLGSGRVPGGGSHRDSTSLRRMHGGQEIRTHVLQGAFGSFILCWCHSLSEFPVVGNEIRSSYPSFFEYCCDFDFSLSLILILPQVTSFLPWEGVV